MSGTNRETSIAALPFHVHASAVSCPPPAELALSLAWELGDLDVDRVERDLTASAAALADIPRDPLGQLSALAEAAPDARGDGGELLIDRVLRRGHGHPLLVAIVLSELGRRAGIPVGLVGGECGHFVAHQRLSEPLVIDPALGELVDANDLGTLHWQCGHQVAAALLDLLQPRYERAGDLTRAVHVASLRCALPFDETHEAERRLRHLRARLN